MKKIWGMTDTILKQISYNSHDFISIELGIQIVNPLDIIGLSRKLDEEKLSTLRRKIAENGWQDIEPHGISLIRLPDQSYVVNAGGNHRSFLCNEFGINNIQAQVTAFVAKNELNDNQLAEIMAYEEIICKLYRKNQVETNERKRLKNLNIISEVDLKYTTYLNELYHEYLKKVNVR
ncbi:hypothetical protein ABER99_21515 [Paenibacillus glucanolyticus]|jgi:hypothetical protein|uniref:hypothetical protein n=1 Tax=Paenibacillus glucanolyticus TaxID=59843 RepID=UPI000FDAA840|nr:hypothetical protein [Paenibacillus glucanolyticus]